MDFNIYWMWPRQVSSMLFLLCVVAGVIIRFTWRESIDSTLSTTKLIGDNGYAYETHHVTTVDGYILELHRIPSTGGRPVILMHGLLDSSAAWVMSGRQNGFAYILSNSGYDVWLGNCRGNIYSQQHKQYEANGRHWDRKRFWNFSWHEIGVYDLPAIIDYVSSQTNYTKFHYVGHSQGMTAFFVMTSERPEYNEKFLLVTALAPVAYMTGVCESIGLLASKHWPYIEYLNDWMGVYAYTNTINELTSLAIRALCWMGFDLKPLCGMNFLPVFGNLTNHMNMSIVPIVTTLTPAGSSYKQMFHYTQLIATNRFAQYDYGDALNVEKYGNRTPPDYSLDNCTAPVALFYSDQDTLARSANVQRLAQKLPNVIALRRIPDDTFNHIDFVWAADAKDFVYSSVLNLMYVADQTDTK